MNHRKEMTTYSYGAVVTVVTYGTEGHWLATITVNNTSV